MNTKPAYSAKNPANKRIEEMVAEETSVLVE
jgi:hypothetical protein